MAGSGVAAAFGECGKHFVPEADRVGTGKILDGDLNAGCFSVDGCGQHRGPVPDWDGLARFDSDDFGIGRGEGGHGCQVAEFARGVLGGDEQLLASSFAVENKRWGLEGQAGRFADRHQSFLGVCDRRGREGSEADESDDRGCQQVPHDRWSPLWNRCRVGKFDCCSVLVWLCKECSGRWLFIRLSPPVRGHR